MGYCSQFDKAAISFVEFKWIPIAASPHYCQQPCIVHNIILDE